jgi:ubiquinone/menaquinone biosynthesis C-methylase UbiE
VLGYTTPFLPYQPDRHAYLRPKPIAQMPNGPPAELPIPPAHLWLGYGQTVELYLGSGQRHVSTMCQLLAEAGWSFHPGGRVLEFGCGAGRMTRWLIDHAATCEIWGTDISAKHIVWCQQHLSPPLHFVTTTTLPHLPFEDHAFGLVYAGSVFSHLDDLADAWFLELRRITRPGGLLYITVMDQNSIQLLTTPRWKGFWLAQALPRQPAYQAFIRERFGMFTIGRALQAQVFYDQEYLCSKLSRWFKVRSVTPEAYGFQTAIILEKRP